MKKMIHGIGLVLGKTVLVTVVVALSFCLFGLLGLPAWAQGCVIIPAGYVFAKLAGEPVSSVHHWLPFMLVLTLLTFVFSRWFPQAPDSYRAVAFLAFFMAAPIFSNSFRRRRLRRGMSPLRHKHEP